MAAALFQAAHFPVAPRLLSTLLLVAAAVVTVRPAAVLVILPALMPVLDLAPLSGRVLWDEFDLLQLALLSVAWWRSGAQSAATAPPRSPLCITALTLLSASLALGLLRGGTPWHWPDANSMAIYHDRYNALRIAKGALWALALAVVMRRLPGGLAGGTRLLGVGLCSGLAPTVLVVLWERVAFVGLGDFDAVYRVTGPFSSMNTGGAVIECYLAMAAAAAMAAHSLSRHWIARLALLLVLLATTYAMMVTYSRNGYGALLAAATVVALGVALQPGASLARRLGAGFVLAAMLGAAVPVLLGSFARDRLAATVQDLAVRQAHWRDALALRDPGPATRWLGEGLGRFPDLHYWRSTEPARAGVFRRIDEDGTTAVRLGAGSAVYVEQFVDVGQGRAATLTLRVRAAPGTRLGIALCEKWLLTSAQCARIEPIALPAADGTWHAGEWRLDTMHWEAPPLARAAKFALYHAGGAGAIDVTAIRLGEDARPLLANGDFRQGLDHWYFSTDVDPPWHIHSWPVTVLFEQGWLGVLAWSMVVAFALVRSVRRASQGDLIALGTAAAIVAFIVSSTVNTLADAPRLLWLWCLMLWLAIAAPAQAPIATSHPQ